MLIAQGLCSINWLPKNKYPFNYFENKVSQVINVSALAGDGDWEGELLSSFLFKNKVSQVINVSALVGDGDGDEDSELLR